MFTASVKNEDGNAVGNAGSETQTMQADSTLTADGDIEPYAVATTYDHKSYFSAAGHIPKQASDESRYATTAHVHNPKYGENLQQASDDIDSDVPKARHLPKVNGHKENKKYWLATLVVILVLTGGITYGIMAGVHHNTQDIQEAGQ
ncbi:hypothetical protein Bbelb_160520 [Branchiostoma belcheri]|nr:hypothetical protein Bbelb_160520 [Branchiostoma belcheri]